MLPSVGALLAGNQGGLVVQELVHAHQRAGLGLPSPVAPLLIDLILPAHEK